MKERILAIMLGVILFPGFIILVLSGKLIAYRYAGFGEELMRLAIANVICYILIIIGLVIWLT